MVSVTDFFFFTWDTRVYTLIQSLSSKWMLQPPHHWKSFHVPPLFWLIWHVWNSLSLSPSPSLSLSTPLHPSLSLSLNVPLSERSTTFMWAAMKRLCVEFSSFPKKTIYMLFLDARILYRNITCILTLVIILSYQCRNTHDATSSTG